MQARPATGPASHMGPPTPSSHMGPLAPANHMGPLGPASHMGPAPRSQPAIVGALLRLEPTQPTWGL